MFSGIIQAKVKIREAKNERGIKRVRVEKPRSWKLSLGQSVAIDGICSTVVRRGASFFDVEYMSETLGKTTAAQFQKGRAVNLERSLKLGDLVDGHFVQGHVDARCRVASVEADGAARRISIEIPNDLMRYVAPRGSITLNGVSLTVASVEGNRARVSLIPHTLAHTNLAMLREGSEVNVETDLIARYRVAAGLDGGTVGRNAAHRIREGLRGEGRL